MNSLEQFNHFYSVNPEAFYEASLLEFFNSVVSKRIESPCKILDLGPGTKSIFEDTTINHSLVTALDYSPKALENAKKNSSIDYRLGDITQDVFLERDLYDLVFDSHCLHCVTDANSRSLAFKNILAVMKSEALFAAEMMVQPVKGKIEMPHKYIPEAFNLEKELQNAGFRIEYFMIGKGLSFKNAHGECDVLRVMARK